MNELEKLTIDWTALEGVYEGIRVDIPVDALGSATRLVQEEGESLLVLEQRGLCRLSDETRKRELLRLAKKAKGRKPYTRKPGTVHPKTKLKTKRLRAERRWKRDPVACLQNSYGYWSLDQTLWDRYIKPIWTGREEVKRTAKGTKADPHTIWNILILDRKTKAVLYDGNSMLLYSLSCS